MRISTRWLGALAAAALLWLAAAPSPAAAQSTCNVSVWFAPKYVPTSAQWQACWNSKQDALGYMPVNKAGDSMLGLLRTLASSLTSAGLNLPHGVAPTSPVDGDLWTTSLGLYTRISGATVGPMTGQSNGTWTPSPTSLTVSGTPTYAGFYVKAGRRVHVEATVSSTVTTASTAGTTFFTGLPFASVRGVACAGAASTTAHTSYGGGYVTGTTFYPPTWSATASVVLTCDYETAS